MDLIATEDYSDLSPLQRKAHLAFWYESEVQNGGHGQYFENQGTVRLEETIQALQDLGLSEQAQVLARALRLLGDSATTTGGAGALPGGLCTGLDAAFHQCSPSIMDGLERHLEQYQGEYVDLV